VKNKILLIYSWYYCPNTELLKLVDMDLCKCLSPPHSCLNAVQFSQVENLQNLRLKFVLQLKFTFLWNMKYETSPDVIPWPPLPQLGNFYAPWQILFPLWSVGIALGYRLDDRDSRVRFPVGARNFSLHHRVQNGSGALPASYPMGNRCSFPGGKAAGAWSWPLISI
jgi:hypothetical protein